MKNYKATSWNQTYILNIFALVISWNEKLQNYNPKLNIYTGYFGHGHKFFFSWNKKYKITTQNRTRIPNILVPVRGWNEKLQSYKLKSNMYTEYFCPGHKLFFSRNKNYKATTQNRTHIPNILALVRGWNEKLQSYKLKSNIYTEYFCPGHLVKWKTTKLQAKIEHTYWIFWPWS